MKATGSGCDIKVASYDDLDADNIIDFWDLKPPAVSVKNTEAEEVQAPLNNNDTEAVDPLDAVISNFSEIIDRTDDREFLSYSDDNGSFSQSEIGEDEREEFLESNEVSEEE